MVVWDMRVAVFTFELREERRGVLVQPGELVTDEQRLVLQGRIHEVKQLLIEEEERPN